MVFAVALLAAVAVGAQAQTFTTINARPLRINVGADGSFQIFNFAVPGVGQVFPTGNDLADMGIFANIDGTLFAPNFAAHSGGSATGALGAFTAWEPRGITPVTGQGTAESPFNVNVALAAPGTDVRVNMNVSYVSGNNFFRVRSNFFTTGNNTRHDIDVTFGADIFLAASDNGFFISVPSLSAVGGRNCVAAEGEYNILLIPITAANRFTASFFSDVWAQIAANELNNSASGTACVDNGAAIQWTNIMSGTATAVELSHAVSFGAIPSPTNFHGFFLNVTPAVVSLAPGESTQLTIRSQNNPELGFNSPVTFSAPDLPPGVSITFNQNTLAAPGNGTVTATLRLDPNIFPQTYNLAIAGTGGNETRFGLFSVEVQCTPPTILGLATSQPQSITVPRGSRARLRVKPEGAGAFTYQWYQGVAPMFRNPMPNSNSAEFETPPITEPTRFWVRVSNACGSVNSLTAVVTPQ